MGSETVADATVKLHGQSSWLQTVMFDGDRAKMQFDVAFDARQSQRQVPWRRASWCSTCPDPTGRSCTTGSRTPGCARAGIMAALREQRTPGDQRQPLRALRRRGERRPPRDRSSSSRRTRTAICGRGAGPGDEHKMPNWDRQRAFWAANGPRGTLSAIVDVQGSLTSWAARGAAQRRGRLLRRVPQLLHLRSGDERARVPATRTPTRPSTGWPCSIWPAFDDHPVFWWEGRAAPAPAAGTALGDRASAMPPGGASTRTLSPRSSRAGTWEQIEGWIDTWSQQIAADVAADPHAWATPANFQQAVATAREVVAKRAALPAQLRRLRERKRRRQRRRRRALVRRLPRRRPGHPPRRARVCCNGIDDNCNGAVDEGCP